MVKTVNWIRYGVRLASVLLFIGVLSAAAAPVRVAIIGDSGERGTEAGVADMLVAQLSAHKDIALVEREQIQKALDEQGLTVAGFVAADAAVATGQLLAVDLFAAIETLRLKPHDSLLRLRVIDARTGLVLDSAFAEDVSRETAPIAFRDTIMAAVAKTRVPMQQRRYVCLLGMRSEEPGRFLDGLAQGLHFLLGHDLNRSSNVHLLDRERLRRLTEEQALSGIDLDLRASALLVDCGVRRVAGQDGLSFRVELRPVSGGHSHAFDVVTASRDMAAVRKVLAARILTELNAGNGSHAAGDAVREAALLLKRVKHLVAHEAGLEPVRLAEAAHALAPSQESRLWLAKAYNVYSRSLYSKTPSAEDKICILTTKSRERHIVLELYREHARLRQKGAAPSLELPMFLGSGPAAVVANPDETRVKTLLQEDVLLDKEIARFKIDYYARHAGDDHPHGWRVAWTLRQSMTAARRGSSSAREWVDEMQRLYGLFIEHCGPTREPGRSAPFPVGLMSHRSLERFKHSGEADVVDELWQWMIEHEDPLIVLTGFANRKAWKKEKARETADAAWTYFRDELPIDHPERQRNYDDQIAVTMAGILAGGLPLDERAACCVEVIEQAIESGEGQRVLRWMSAMGNWHTLMPSVLSEEDQRDLVRRALDVYRSDPYVNNPTGFKPPEGDKRSYLRHSDFEPKLKRVLAKLGVGEPVPNAFWSRFRISSLLLQPPEGRWGHWDLDWISPDGDGWVAAWLGPRDEDQSRHLLVAAYQKDGGTPEVVGRLVLPGNSGNGPVLRGLARVGERVYMGCYAGLIVIENGTAELRDESAGLPASHVTALVGFRDGVYFSVIAGRGGGGAALCGIDPTTDLVTTFASSRSLEKRSPLDGEFLYTIDSMLADAGRDCVWLAVSMRGPVGLWKFVPADGSITKVCHTPGQWLRRLVSCNGRILGETYSPICAIDPENGELEYLTVRPDATYGNHLSGIKDYGQLGSSLLAIVSRCLNVLEIGARPVEVTNLPNGEILPPVSRIWQLGDNRVLIQPEQLTEESQGAVWILEADNQGIASK